MGPGVKGAVQDRKTGIGKHAGRGQRVGKQEQPEGSGRCAETQSGAGLLEASPGHSPSSGLSYPQCPLRHQVPWVPHTSLCASTLGTKLLFPKYGQLAASLDLDVFSPPSFKNVFLIFKCFENRKSHI